MRWWGWSAALAVVTAGALVAGVATGHVRLGHAGRLRLPALFHAAPPKPVMVSVPAITTNLAGADNGHFAEVAITLELRDKTVATAFDQREAAVYDAVIADLRGESLASLGGDAGMRLLRGQVQASLDRVLGAKDAVRAVFFTQFVVQ